MERDKKIEKINAYNRLLGLALKSVTKDEEIQAEIQTDFVAFVNTQLESLMGTAATGEKPAYSRLNDTEVDILKDFVSRTLARANGEAAPAPRAPRVPMGTPPKNAAPQALAKASGQPLTPAKPVISTPVRPGAMTAKDVNRFASNPHAYAQALEQMDGYDPDGPPDAQ